MSLNIVEFLKIVWEKNKKQIKALFDRNVSTVCNFP